MSYNHRLTGSTSILPATRCLFNKNKVSAQEVAEFFKDGAIEVWNLSSNRGDRKIFVSTAGSGGPVSKQGHAHHDQTFSHIGYYTVAAVIPVVDGKVDFHWQSLKLPLYVYK
jgi:hypothetical protein